MTTRTEEDDLDARMEMEIEITADAAILIRGAIATIEAQAARLGHVLQVSEETVPSLQHYCREMITALDNDPCPI